MPKAAGAKGEKHVQISARIPAELADALERSAQDADRSFSAELRRALKEYLAPARARELKGAA